MKKTIRLFLCMLLVLVMIPLNGYAFGDANNSKNVINDVPKEFQLVMEMQEPALKAYQNIWNSFAKDDTGTPIYPEEYAGEYINVDKLVIMLVNASEEMKADYIMRSKDSQYVVFEDASYSLNYLNSLDQVAYDLGDQGYNLASYGVDRKANRYFISIVEDDYNTLMSSKSLLNQYINNDMPISIEPSTQILSTSTLWGGEEIANEDTGNIMSIGIGGTFNGSNAILTCGHGNEKVGIFTKRYPYISYNGSRTGQVSYQRANTTIGDTGINSLGDFAIVNLTGNDTPTNRVYGASITGTYSSVPVGTAIYKFGRTTNHSYGTVTNVAITVNYSGSLGMNYEVRGLYQSTMQNSDGTDAIGQGDSGGPVYMKDGSAYKLHGIVTALKSPTSGPATIMYSTPIYYAEHAGFTVKTTD